MVEDAVRGINGKAVAQWVKTVSQLASSQDAVFWVAVATLIVAVISVIVAVIYGEIQRRSELRPRLVLSVGDPPLTYYGMTVAHADAVLTFAITNVGETTAHNAFFRLHLEEQPLVEFVGLPYPSQHEFAAGDISPGRPGGTVPLNVRIHSYGPARVNYQCWCDEARMIEGDIDFEVTAAPAHVQEAPEFAIDKPGRIRHVLASG